MKQSWKAGISILLCLACIGCGESPSRALPKPTFVYAMDGDGKSKEHPMYTTIEELNAHPEKYENKWVFFQAYLPHPSIGHFQNKPGTFLIDDQINPDIQYIWRHGTTTEETWNDIMKISSYATHFAVDAVVQVEGHFRKEFLETLEEEAYCICVDEIYLTDWVDMESKPQSTPKKSEEKPARTGEMIGEGTIEKPYIVTMGELKRYPEEYNGKWVEFDAYLYCGKNGWDRPTTLLQEYEEEKTENRDKIDILITPNVEGYEAAQELFKQLAQSGEIAKVHVIGKFELNPYELKGDAAERIQRLATIKIEKKN